MSQLFLSCCPGDRTGGGKTAGFANGTKFDLLPGRTFRTIRRSGKATEELAKECHEARPKKLGGGERGVDNLAQHERVSVSLHSHHVEAE